MREIGELLGRHTGKTAWIFGKGPSLDAFAMDSAGPLRLCVNESMLAVPEPMYFFAHDERPIENVAASWPSGGSAILQQVRGEHARKCGIAADCIYVYEKRYADNRIRDMEAAGLASEGALYGNSGTVHCAIHFCRLIGVSRIVMVGFDGSGGYAKRLGLPDGGADHERIRQASISLLDVMQIDYEFFIPEAAPPLSKSRGTMTT